MSNTDKTLLWMILTLLGAALTLGLGAVWLNIERMDLAYDLRKMEKSLNQKEALAVKLTVERNNQVSPYQLKKLAGKQGLGVAAPGQIRRIADTQ
jgi:cell division protein FtsL